uniref:AT rich interactive domain 4A (RBP1-like) n=1 Tax=Oryzias latipes TaxID=8090 RepID=A0A3P9JWQ8_ORYLA
FQAADEPAYLTVGTDVSAKYRGAFCEAKIKTVKRMVKVKVTLKGESASQVVQDDQVKGPLRVGSTVEVKTNEGLCGEAVISKLTDASLYTVVFDDGDEKTLRRTSLCLKGERHFAESETLDQLPLTNPEHFGTPVIGKKSNRGGRRSSQAILDEENDTTSSEEEEEDRKRPSEELLGQICSIENVEDSASWFLALVVSTSCNEELQVKKDQCLVRSFDDGKFCIVARRHVHVVTAISISKAQFLNRRGEAQMFLKNGEIPDVWKMDMSQILDTEEPEEEADPEERDNFLQQLYKFMEDRGTPINKPPVLGYKDLNLFKLFRLVYQQGGCHKIESGTVWKQIYMDLGIPVLNSAASYNVKTAYKKYLFGFEEYCRSASIAFRTIHHNDPPPPTLANHKKARAELKEPSVPTLTEEEPVDNKREESDSESEREIRERPSLRGRRRGAGSRGKPPSRLEFAARAADSSEEQQREARRRSNRRAEDSERDRLLYRSGDEEDGDSLAGTKVRVKYGRGKTQKIYEAHIKKTDSDSGEQFYLVHYYGWNVRYDEWVKADRIIWPSEKGTKRSSSNDSESEEKPPKSSPWRGRNKLSPGQEALHVTSPSKAPALPPPNTPPPPPVSSIPATDEDSRSALPSSPRVRGRKANQREQASETPPTIPLCALSPAPIFPSSPPQTSLLPSPPRSVLKRQEEPMVVLHCLPSQHLPVKSPVPNSDTDSASEEEAESQEEAPPEQSSCVLKRKAAEQRPAEKKLCCDGRSDDAPVTPKTTPGSSPKPLNSPLRPERRSEAVAKGDEAQENSEERLSAGDEKRPESCTGTAPTVSGTVGPAPHGEQEPQIGPEALVCHEVDLDDPDEREKPASAENLLLLMRDQQAPPPRLSVHSSSPAQISPPPLQTQVRSYIVTPTSVPCPEELQPANTGAEPALTRAEQEDDSSPGFTGSASPSSTSLVSLQDTKDRGQKRVNECNSSPSAKKHKRSQKRPNTPGKSEKNGAGHSSDSEDQTRVSSLSKSHKSRCPSLSSPTAHGKDKQGFPSPQRSYKWTLQLDDLDSMTSAERISFLQDKLQEIRKYYMSLKSEVASIDRRRKRLKKKEREVSNTTVSTSSGSSDTGMSPSSASPAQNAVAVECR